MSAIWTYKNKHDVYRGQDCIKNFSEFLREHTLKINNFEKKRNILSTNEQEE